MGRRGQCDTECNRRQAPGGAQWWLDGRLLLPEPGDGGEEGQSTRTLTANVRMKMYPTNASSVPGSSWPCAHKEHPRPGAQRGRGRVTHQNVIHQKAEGHTSHTPKCHSYTNVSYTKRKREIPVIHLPVIHQSVTCQCVHHKGARGPRRTERTRAPQRA